MFSHTFFFLNLIDVLRTFKNEKVIQNLGGTGTGGFTHKLCTDVYKRIYSGNKYDFLYFA